FNLKIGDPKQLKFFESSIDLLSYAALNRDQLNDTWLVSMEGLKHHVISHYFGEAVSELRKKQAFPQSIEICVDNDRAGHIFYEKEQLMGAVDPFTNQKVRCERGIANDWQVPKEYKVIYEEVAKEMKVEPEAIMAIHKTENNLQLTDQLVSAHKVNASFGQQLSVNDSIEAINLKDICREVAKELKGFNLKIGDPKQLKFFESSIDLLSYAALNRDQLNDTWLVSMEGLKHHVISHYFGEAVSELRKKQAFPQSIEICVDNDRAGHIFYEKEQLMGAVDPFTNQKVHCERGIANDWQVPKEYKIIYEEVAKEEKVTPEAIMAIHKTENNLQLTNQLVSAHKVNASFGQRLSVNDSIEAINLKDICREVAKELKA
ncbi:toprim domain-containing protein, partial [Enterococcus faecium]|uniref:toprim domain-containing protein n=1 Tax=Enterococcus faecium TaxID=1352 RepID=UPI002073923C